VADKQWIERVKENFFTYILSKVEERNPLGRMVLEQQISRLFFLCFQSLRGGSAAVSKTAPLRPFIIMPHVVEKGATV
jgi:hypothetical protein